MTRHFDIIFDTSFLDIIVLPCLTTHEQIILINLIKFSFHVALPKP